MESSEANQVQWAWEWGVGRRADTGFPPSTIGLEALGSAHPTLQSKMSNMTTGLAYSKRLLGLIQADLNYHHYAI